MVRTNIPVPQASSYEHSWLTHSLTLWFVRTFLCHKQVRTSIPGSLTHSLYGSYEHSWATSKFVRAFLAHSLTHFMVRMNIPGPQASSYEHSWLTHSLTLWFV